MKVFDLKMREIKRQQALIRHEQDKLAIMLAELQDGGRPVAPRKGSQKSELVKVGIGIYEASQNKKALARTRAIS